MFDDFPLRFFDLGLLGLELNGDGQIAFLDRKKYTPAWCATSGACY